MTEEKRYPVSCNRDCGAGCALTAITESGKITKIKDAEERPEHMRGCLKGYRAMETTYHPDRLTTPLIRTGARGSGEFRKAGWDEALDLIASKLEKLRSENQCSEVMRIGGSGSCRGALHNSVFTTLRFLSLYGPYTDTKGNYSSEATDYVKGPVFGTREVGIDAATLLHSDHIILWGFNPFDTRFDSEVESVLKRASEKGINITVIDPRKTRTVKSLNTRWIPLKPGSDSALMLAILHTLITEGLIKRDFIDKYSVGFDSFEEYVMGRDDGKAKTPEWAAGLCGLSPESIRQFARDYVSGGTTALLPGLSLQRALGGENTDRLGSMLQLATGNAGRLGGSSGAGKWNRLGKPKQGSLPIPGNPHTRFVPVYRWADEVLKGGISFLYNVGGNYLGQSSDTSKVIKAFEKADFSVTHDYFLTDTAKYCDVVLPVTTFLEREDLVNTQNNYIFYTAKVIEPVGESKNDYDIFLKLAERLGFGDEFGEGKSEKEWLDLFLEQSEIDDIEDFKRKGFYDGGEHERIGLVDFFRDPDANPLKTPSSKIEIASEAILQAGGTLLPEHFLMETTESFPLRMITPHEKYRIHSQNDNIPSLKKLCDDRLWINKKDAESRDMVDGDQIDVISPEGNISVECHVTDEIAQGTVSLNQGVWPMSSSRGANANYLTSTEPTLPSNGSRTHSIIVNVKKHAL